MHADLVYETNDTYCETMLIILWNAMHANLVYETNGTNYVTILIILWNGV